MPRYNTPGLRGRTVTSPIRSTGDAPAGLTHEGGPGWARDTKSELFLLAVTNLVGQDTFYEAAGDRDSRYRRLIRQVAVDDPVWTAGFLRWLRRTANLRTAPIIGAAEAVQARREAGQHHDPVNRHLIGGVLHRADEPGEFLAYWQSTYGGGHGGRLPQAVRKGVGDAAVELYTQRATLRYDTPRPWRFGDVLNVTHPSPARPWQRDLFRHLLDRRYGRDTTIPASLATLTANRGLRDLPVPERRRWLEATHAAGQAAHEMEAAGMSWEALAGWLQGPMDATAWSAIAPTMGYMALLRNLRNFDEAGLDDGDAFAVAGRLMDPGEVERSRVLPLRFLAAYNNVPSLRWSYALERALNLSMSAVPALPGRTLILVDRSGSMGATLSGQSELTRADAAGLFGGVLALRCASATLVQFGTGSQEIPVPAGGSVLSLMFQYRPMGGTDTFDAVARHYAGHDRVIILTDEQAAPWEEHEGRGYSTAVPGMVRIVPADTPVYTWDLAGYVYGHAPSGYDNWHTFGGLSDAAFGMIPLLEDRQRGAAWPWETPIG